MRAGQNAPGAAGPRRPLTAAGSGSVTISADHPPPATMEHSHHPMTGSPDYRLSHLQALEAESIHIFREVAAELERPALMFSGGKD
jgi:hypothetical protein